MVSQENREKENREEETRERTMSFRRSLAFFEANREDLVLAHHGRHAVIHDGRLAGLHPDVMQAFRAARREFPPGSFLIVRCLRKSEERPVRFRSRVA